MRGTSKPQISRWRMATLAAAVALGVAAAPAAAAAAPIPSPSAAPAPVRRHLAVPARNRRSRRSRAPRGRTGIWSTARAACPRRRCLPARRTRPSSRRRSPIRPRSSTPGRGPPAAATPSRALKRRSEWAVEPGHDAGPQCRRRVHVRRHVDHRLLVDARQRPRLRRGRRCANTAGHGRAAERRPEQHHDQVHEHRRGRTGRLLLGADQPARHDHLGVHRDAAQLDGPLHLPTTRRPAC